MKTSRQNKIVELINQYDVETQEELADLLNKEGYHVTQATVSRDIRELKLSKVTASNGKQKYAVLMDHQAGLNEKYVRVLRDAFVSADHAGNILVIKTISGMAMAAAAALDALNFSGIVGCIAGDDTIMCAVRTETESISIMAEIRGLFADKR